MYLCALKVRLAFSDTRSCRNSRIIGMNEKYYIEKKEVMEGCASAGKRPCDCRRARTGRLEPTGQNRRTGTTRPPPLHPTLFALPSKGYTILVPK